MNTYEISYIEDNEPKHVTIKAESGCDAKKKFIKSDAGLSEILSIINRGATDE